MADTLKPRPRRRTMLVLLGVAAGSGVPEGHTMMLSSASD